MAQKTKEQSKEAMASVEILIGRILQGGVFISAAILALGLLLFLINQSGGYPAGQHPQTILTILSGVVAFKPFAIMMLGLFCLILTPVLRVVVSIYAFAKEHDTQYVVITTIVLIILVISFVIGYF
ncbi:putative membrane protein [Secundilactobacillus oryzae JCM 18671]|uniref:Putative membrane protein n=1 Tax=Secundilactobacillus oryzae JCM 18671 TaxID=1291743 RepID=A0A081BKL9_9LACO|nr:DUF1634 domain-containing protein [Secundilactobacillus oryzae]GAK48587.1 putative membrane protein [Secundilactobacillus oryzae JCM 18671]